MTNELISDEDEPFFNELLFQYTIVQCSVVLQYFICTIVVRCTLYVILIFKYNKKKEGDVGVVSEL